MLLIIDKQIILQTPMCQAHNYILSFFLFAAVYGGPHERRLLNDLLSNYQVLERPVSNESDVLNVTFSLTLQQVIDVVCVGGGRICVARGRVEHYPNLNPNLIIWFKKA